MGKEILDWDQALLASRKLLPKKQKNRKISRFDILSEV
jgi:hypothetical protein